ncbi:hypothetical protein Y1Q_0016454 [Alligator mississippiensis]|uniref:Uncharacterized protein n=1 Tax=Alligator mississippiensis TaxID=8496 RepID=A0A151N2V5_ALLMI|nr:hypothetical protein Y1Q_0016454 [Alligator mississippiensis]
MQMLPLWLWIFFPATLEEGNASSLSPPREWTENVSLGGVWSVLQNITVAAFSPWCSNFLLILQFPILLFMVSAVVWVNVSYRRCSHGTVRDRHGSTEATPTRPNSPSEH